MKNKLKHLINFYKTKKIKIILFVKNGLMIGKNKKI